MITVTEGFFTVKDIIFIVTGVKETPGVSIYFLMNKRIFLATGNKFPVTGKGKNKLGLSCAKLRPA